MAPERKMKRTRFEVLPAGDGSWDVTRDSVTIGNYAVKSLAVQYAVDRAKASWAKKQPAQLLIKGRDGKIKDERTYGNDPERTRG